MNQSTQAASVTMTFYDQNGTVLLAVPPFNMAIGQHLTSVLTTAPAYSAVIGKQGTVVIQTTAPSINVLAARTSPDGDVSGISPTSF